MRHMTGRVLGALALTASLTACQAPHSASDAKHDYTQFSSAVMNLNSQVTKKISSESSKLSNPVPVNTSQGQSAPMSSGGYTFTQYPDAGFSGLYQQINNERTSINMEMYSLKDSTLVQDLVNAHKRGVKVTVLLDQAFGMKKSNADAYNTLKSAGVPVKWAPAGYIYHIKTTVFGNKVADISTANLNANDYANTVDGMIQTTNAEQVHAISQTFSNDFNGGLPQDNTVQASGLLWSPHAESGMTQAISAAKHSIYYSSEELADQPVIQALAADAERGVTCNVEMTNQASYDDAYSTLTSSGCKVHLVKKSTSLPYIHEKIVLTDGSHLTIGSQNASKTSLNRNRELSIQINDSGISQKVISEFNKIAAQGTIYNG